MGCYAPANDQHGDFVTSLSDMALLHLRFLMAHQGTTETVRLKDDCPRCAEIKKALR